MKNTFKSHATHLIQTHPKMTREEFICLVNTLVEQMEGSDSVDKHTIVNLLREVRNLVPAALDIKAVALEAAQIAYKKSYYVIANELLQYVNDDNDNAYVCLKADTLAISGQFAKALELLKTYAMNSHEAENCIEAIAKYGYLLIAYLPVNESTRVRYLREYVQFIEKLNITRQLSGELLYYWGRCYEELFNCSGVTKDRRNAYKKLNAFIDAYKDTDDNQHKITVMEAYWAKARIAKSGYYGASGNHAKNICKKMVLDNYSRSQNMVASFPIYKELSRSYYTQFYESTAESGRDGIVYRIMHDSKMHDIENVYYHNDLIRKQFVSERHRLETKGAPCLHVLQRWNSYTPILADVKAPSRGGGYYLETGRSGIVIDPGFDFIQNFREAGFFLNDIDYIFISHAHNDHSADLESLTTLLYDYNNKEIKGDKYSYKRPYTIYQQILRENPTRNEDEINDLVAKEYERSPRRKKFTIFMTQSTSRKFGFLDIRKASDIKTIIINTDFDSSCSCQIVQIPSTGNKVLSCSSIYAKHDDLISDAHCVGLIFEYDDTALIYTGDTGYDQKIHNLYTKMSDTLKTNNKEIILLAHIGGFKQEEKYGLYPEPNSTGITHAMPFYKKHLGRLGLVKVVEDLKPNLCIISEFGEEFRGNCRVEISKLLFECFYKPNQPHNPFFIPADIGLQVRFDMVVKAITKEYAKEGDMVMEDFVEYSSIDYFEDNVSPEYPIYYYKKGVLDKNPLKSVYVLKETSKALH